MDYYLGEIRLFAGYYAPVDWKFCNGEILPIKNFEPLFALLGATYGGDGVTNFALPNLQGRLPVSTSGNTPPPGLQYPYPMASTGGVNAVALAEANLPAHNHAFMATTADATTLVPGNTVTFAKAPAGFISYISNPASLVQLNGYAISASGQSAPHNNDMPTICINYIIATTGGFFPQKAN